jgi:hypothetical protein
LLAKDAVLLAQEVDHLQLARVDPVVCQKSIRSVAASGCLGGASSAWRSLENGWSPGRSSRTTNRPSPESAALGNACAFASPALRAAAPRFRWQ